MPSYLFELKNSELGGGLRDHLRKSRKEGLSYRTISAQLSASGTSVGRTAVEEWCKALVEPPKKKKKGK
jgi:intein-encoded DNA endonuclease-like protein